MKSVLMSIQPKWCELIASGEKTVEVRKTKPKLETPFKVYIYCTAEKDEWNGILIMDTDDNLIYYSPDCHNANDIFLNRKVIGEFVCDDISEISLDKLKNFEDLSNMILANKSCLENEEIINYLGDKSRGYAWHISDLKIYDNPKELRQFYNICKEVNSENPKCEGCEHYDEDERTLIPDCELCGIKFLKRPPQSWCYVEEILK